MADETRPARYVYQIYVYAVCFVTILILLFTVASFAYAIVRIAAPGTTAKGGFGGFSFLGSFADSFGSGGGGERDRGLVQLTQSGILGIASGALFFVHWGWATRLQAAAERAERFRPSAPAKRKASRPRKPKATPSE